MPRERERATIDGGDPGDAGGFNLTRRSMSILGDGVPDSVVAARGAGIRVVMITGDYLLTAIAIAKNVTRSWPWRDGPSHTFQPLRLFPKAFDAQSFLPASPTTAQQHWRLHTSPHNDVQLIAVNYNLEHLVIIYICIYTYDNIIMA
jgi:hypothetical protein